MVTTNSDELAARLRLYKGQGMDPQRRYWFPVVGYNYRMTNIQAAIGLAQMEEIESILQFRLRLASWYDEALGGMQDRIVLPTQAPGTKHVYWMYNIFLRDADGEQRDHVMSLLDDLGIETRPVFYPMHVMPPYFEPETYPVADKWSPRGINLPTHHGLTKDDIQRIARSLDEVTTR